MPQVMLGSGSCTTTYSTHSLARRPSLKDGAGRHRLDALRRVYFAQAHEAAAKFGVGFDELVLHLWTTREHAGVVNLLNCKHVADVVFVIALLNGSPSAWAQFHDRYERTLIRQASTSYQEIEATVVVRRLISELRFNLPHIAGGRPVTLRAYNGRRSLRAWLGERLGSRLRAVYTRTAEMPAAPRRFAAASPWPFRPNSRTPAGHS